MLRASALTNKTQIDLAGVNGDESAAGTGVEFGTQLMKFAESVATRDESALKAARDELLQVAGEAVLVDAAGVAANFQRMVRIADSMGIPVDDMEEGMGKQVREELNLERFPSAHNSLSMG
ncbi:MAG: hypothetical protein JKY98_02105 [Gammaproteobacteria bacterium]|nr:hypothetical protein [Gammaproteobacteria bacterium]